jgi:serine/threonine-protein kinase
MADASACEVWIADVDGDVEGSHPVVLKKLRSELAQNTALLESFEQRAREATLLNHECVAKVLDVVTVRGESGLAMEYVDGKSLRQLILAVGGAANALPVWFAIHVAHCICQGLEQAHEMRDEQGLNRPIFHRALDPENVFLTFQGQVKVTDFGTSRRALLAVTHEEQNAPSQPSGMHNTLTTNLISNDIDGVGRVLYELLTGSCPGPSLDASSAFVPPSHYAPWVNHEVDQLLSRLLAPRAPTRFCSIGEVRQALDEYLKTRRHDVTATHIAGLVSLLFSSECHESAPPTARLQQNAVDLAILRSRRTSPPEFPEFEAPTKNSGKQAKHSAPAASQLTRQTVPSPAVSSIDAQSEHTPSAGQPSFFRSPPASVPPKRRVDAPEHGEGRSGPSHHDWDRALQRVRKEVEATQRTSGTIPVAASRAEHAMGPLEQAVMEFERGLEHMRRNELEPALKCWERALEFDPQHRVCRTNLKLLKKKLGSLP